MNKKDIALHTVVLIAFVLIAGFASTISHDIALSPKFEPGESMAIANAGITSSLWVLVGFFGTVMLALLVMYYVLSRV